MSVFLLEIITSRRTFYKKMVNSVTVMGTEGSFNVYKNHLNLTTAFNASKMTIRDRDDNILVCAVGAGVFMFKENKALILAPVCEWQENINIQRAKKSLEEAKKIYLSLASDEDDRALAKMYIDRSQNRIKIRKESVN